MNELQEEVLSLEDGTRAVSFARDALVTYVKQGQRMDVGSVGDFLSRQGGVLVQLYSTLGRSRLKGSAAVYEDVQLADALIEATVTAASSRSVGSEITRNELNTVAFKVALIQGVTVTSSPTDILEIGADCPIVLDAEEGWLYPTFASEQGWSEQRYLDRTCRKANKIPTAWEDSNLVVAHTETFVEKNPPDGAVIRDKP